MKKLLDKLLTDFPHLSFIAEDQFCWSPSTQQIKYDEKRIKNPDSAWTLLHEVGHALLNHTTYKSDFELIQMESSAWNKAVQLAQAYAISIPENYIQDCLDTYRDWLHLRSACPNCNTHSLQQSSGQYKCFNCNHTWRVSTSRFCRPYRMSKAQKNSASPDRESAAV